MRKFTAVALALVLFGCAKSGNSNEPGRRTDQGSLDVFAAQLAAKTYQSECWSSNDGGSSEGYLQSRIVFGRTVRLRTTAYRDGKCTQKVTDLFEKEMKYVMSSVDSAGVSADLVFHNEDFQSEVYKSVNAHITLGEKSFAIEFSSSIEIRLGQETVLPSWRYAELFEGKKFQMLALKTRRP